MSKIVAIKEASMSKGSRNTWEIGDARGVPEWVRKQFGDHDDYVKGEIAQFEDEGHRVTATCLAYCEDESHRFYVHFPVGNLQEILYAESVGESSD